MLNETIVYPTLSSHLNEHDEEEYAACDVDLLPEEHHGDAAELPHEVDDDEEGGEEPAAAPAARLNDSQISEIRRLASGRKFIYPKTHLKKIRLSIVTPKWKNVTFADCRALP